MVRQQYESLGSKGISHHRGTEGTENYFFLFAGRRRQTKILSPIGQ